MQKKTEDVGEVSKFCLNQLLTKTHEKPLLKSFLQTTVLKMESSP